MTRIYFGKSQALLSVLGKRLKVFETGVEIKVFAERHKFRKGPGNPITDIKPNDYFSHREGSMFLDQ